jgi:hypothetical protein
MRRGEAKSFPLAAARRKTNGMDSASVLDPISRYYPNAAEGKQPDEGE